MRLRPGLAPARHLPWLLLAALAGVGLLLVLATRLAGWGGEVRYATLQPERLPLALSAAAQAPAPDPAARARLSGLDVLDLAAVAPGPAALPTDPGPRLAILVAGVGLARAMSESALGMPPAVALAISPHAETVPAWLRRGRGSGHEVLLMMPLEPADPARVDPGPHAIGPATPAAAREASLAWLLGLGSGQLGVVAEAGAFARAPEAFAPVAEALAGHGLGLVELGGSYLEATARGRGLAYAAAGAALDTVPAPASIDLALGQLEAQALRDGRAVGWLRGHPVSFARLAAWLPTLPGKGLALAPVSALLAQPGRMAATR